MFLISSGEQTNVCLIAARGQVSQKHFKTIAKYFASSYFKKSANCKVTLSNMTGRNNPNTVCEHKQLFIRSRHQGTHHVPVTATSYGRVEPLNSSMFYLMVLAFSLPLRSNEKM